MLFYKLKILILKIPFEYGTLGILQLNKLETYSVSQVRLKLTFHLRQAFNEWSFPT